MRDLAGISIALGFLTLLVVCMMPVFMEKRPSAVLRLKLALAGSISVLMGSCMLAFVGGMLAGVLALAVVSFASRRVQARQYAARLRKLSSAALSGSAEHGADIERLTMAQEAREEELDLLWQLFLLKSAPEPARKKG